MTIKIPSAVLARLQILFQDGASVQEVTKALELDVLDIDQDAEARAPKAGQLAHLTSLAEQLHKHVNAMLDMEQIRDIPAIAGAMDMVAQRANAITREIDALASASPTQQTVPVDAPKNTSPSKPLSAPLSKPPSEPPVSAGTKPSSLRVSPRLSNPEASKPSKARQNAPSAPSKQASRPSGDQIKQSPGQIPTGIKPAPSPAVPSQPEPSNNPSPAPSRSGGELRDKVAAAVSEIDILSAAEPANSSPSMAAK